MNTILDNTITQKQLDETLDHIHTLAGSTPFLSLPDAVL